MGATVALAAAARLPGWRRPEALLFVVAAAMPIAFDTWSALLNNFVIEVAGCTRCARFRDFLPSR